MSLQRGRNGQVSVLLRSQIRRDPQMFITFVTWRTQEEKHRSSAWNNWSNLYAAYNIEN